MKLIPVEYNVFVWEFSDQQGNLLHKNTLVDASTISFGHSWSLTDTIDVTGSLVEMIQLVWMTGIFLRVCLLMGIQLTVYLRINCIGK